MLNTYILGDGFYQSRIDGKAFPYDDGQHAGAWEALTAHNAELIAAGLNPPIESRTEYALSYDAGYALFLPAETGIRWYRNPSCYTYLHEGVVVARDTGEDFDDPLGVLSGCELLGIATYEPSDKRLTLRADKAIYRRCWFVCHDDSDLPFHEVAADESYIDGISWPPKGCAYGGVAVAIKPGDTFPKPRESSVLGYSDRIVSSDMKTEAIKRKREALGAWQKRSDADSVRRYLHKLRAVEVARERKAAALAARNPYKG